ncbi:MAG: DUF4124 domain-containing protein [Proteobacteria bacterium]|nr:DUF4124 domain-containing protein [Pseudomonadota bacterium]
MFSISGFGLFIFVSLIMTTTLHAQIYKWVDANGVMHYSQNKPETIQVEELKLASYNAVSFENSYTQIEHKSIQRNPDLTRQAIPRAKRVTMYSTQWCGVCKKAKAYFKQAGIGYIEYDIDKSKSARARFDKMGAKGVPVIIVGKKRMNGFSVAGFNKIYK